LVARHRPQIPIIALSPRPDVIRRLALVRGVRGIQNSMFFDTDECIADVGKMLARQGLVKPGELIVVTAGIPLASMKPTNVVKLHRISAADSDPLGEPTRISGTVSALGTPASGLR